MKREQLLEIARPILFNTDIVTCKECEYSTLPSKMTQIYGRPGTLTCRNKSGCPCNGRNVNSDDFCSYGKRKEGLQTMDYQEAIKELQNDYNSKTEEVPEWAIAIAEKIVSCLEDLTEYDKIGTIEECREAVERMKPKEPTYDGDGYAPDGTFVWDEWLCPHCGSIFEIDYDQYDYCPNCGQHIDWSEENEQDTWLKGGTATFGETEEQDEV